jgi:hypothetical protein
LFIPFPLANCHSLPFACSLSILSLLSLLALHFLVSCLSSHSLYSHLPLSDRLCSWVHCMSHCVCKPSYPLRLVPVFLHDRRSPCLEACSRA